MGGTGAGIAWQDYTGTWESNEIPLRQEKEVFDAEQIGVYKALEIVKEALALRNFSLDNMILKAFLIL
jgi:hypothetical protein